MRYSYEPDKGGRLWLVIVLPMLRELSSIPLLKARDEGGHWRMYLWWLLRKMSDEIGYPWKGQNFVYNQDRIEDLSLQSHWDCKFTDGLQENRPEIPSRFPVPEIDLRFWLVFQIIFWSDGKEQLKFNAHLSLYFINHSDFFTLVSCIASVYIPSM